MISGTENYNLNQWEANDQVRRVDFNADNAKIDAAIKAVDVKADAKADRSALEAEIRARTALSAQAAKLGNCQIWTTTYTGNGEMTKTLTFPKKPLAVFIMGGDGSWIRHLVGSYYMVASAPATAGTVSIVTWSGTSMTWTIREDQAKCYAGNWSNIKYHVVALMDAAA